MSHAVANVIPKARALILALTPYAHTAREPYNRAYRSYDEPREERPTWDDSFRMLRVSLVSLEPTVARTTHLGPARDLFVTYAVEVSFPAAFPSDLLDAYLAETEREITACLGDSSNWEASSEGAAGPALFVGATRERTDEGTIWRLTYRQPVVECG